MGTSWPMGILIALAYVLGSIPFGLLVGRAKGIDVRKAFVQESDPVAAVLHYLKKHPADLIVLATSQRDGRVRREQL